MTRTAAPSVAFVLALALAALPVTPPAGAVPPGPPARAWLAGGPVACPLHWRPGEPADLFPHPVPVARPDGSGTLVDASGGAVRAEARGWIEVGRPDRALAVLAGSPDGPEERLYRMAALRGLERWPELAAALAAEGGAVLGCGALVDRWTAEAAAAAGDRGEAERGWARLAAGVPALGAYVDLWRLESAARTGDVAAGEAAWARLAGAGLPEMAVRDARAALAGMYARAGRPAAARGWYLEAAEGEPSGRRRAELWLAAAGEADRGGAASEADALRARVLAREPAWAADVVLDPAVRRRMGVSGVAAARALLAAGRPAEAEPFASAEIESGAGADRIQVALLLRAEIRAARGDRAGAERDFAEFLDRWPSDPRSPDAAYDQARLALAHQDGATARRRLEAFIARWPAEPRVASARYLIADSWQDDRTLDPVFAERAIQGFDRLLREHPGSTFTDRATMRAAHLTYALGRLAEAERRYAAYRGSPSAREARYWRARAMERRGDAGARAILAGLARGDDYYALLSRDRLAGRGGAGVFAPRGERALPLDPYPGTGGALLAHPAGRTAAALLAFGERRYAGAELERAVAGLGGDRARLAAWAPALAAWGFPHLTLRIGIRAGGESHPWSYPAGFTAAVDREAGLHGLDPWTVLALIRQESLYRSDVISPADARGLMQILPATGREIADSLGWERFDERELFLPAVNLHLGARYLEDQLARFDGFWPAVLAAYNGGPHVVAVWWDFPERTQDPELWVERIPYRETRDYVKKIAAQRARYRSLYGATGR